MPEAITIIASGWKVELLFTACSDEWKTVLINSLGEIIRRELLPSIPLIGHGYPSGMVVFLANGSAWFLARNLIAAPICGYSLRNWYVNQTVPVTTADWN